MKSGLYVIKLTSSQGDVLSKKISNQIKCSAMLVGRLPDPSGKNAKHWGYWKLSGRTKGRLICSMPPKKASMNKKEPLKLFEIQGKALNNV
jgi:hypothetical protein